MTHISGLNSEAIRPLAAPERTQGAPKVQRPDEDSQSRQPKAMMDEYVPEEPEEPSGRYWIGREQDGRIKSDQEYLDRQDFYTITLYLKGEPGEEQWFDGLIIINGWALRPGSVDL